VFAHTLYHHLSQMAKMPQFLPSVRRIGRMRPGAAMDEEIGRVMLRYQALYSAAARSITQ
jgi:hypothetical protein